MNDKKAFQHFALTMAFVIPFIAFCLFIITNALKPRPVQLPIEVAIVGAPIKSADIVLESNADGTVLKEIQPQETKEVSAQPEPDKHYDTYKVQEGDTLSYIAMIFYGKPSSYQKIADANNIDNPDLIFPGQVLKVPQ